MDLRAHPWNFVSCNISWNCYRCHRTSSEMVSISSKTCCSVLELCATFTSVCVHNIQYACPTNVYNCKPLHLARLPRLFTTHLEHEYFSNNNVCNMCSQVLAKNKMKIRPYNRSSASILQATPCMSRKRFEHVSLKWRRFKETLLLLPFESSLEKSYMLPAHPRNVVRCPMIFNMSPPNLRTHFVGVPPLPRVPAYWIHHLQATLDETHMDCSWYKDTPQQTSFNQHLGRLRSAVKKSP